MSHFYVMVLVKPGKKSVQSQLEDQLAAYDENLEVPEYDKHCTCGEWKAHAEGRAAAEKVRPLEEIRAEHQATFKADYTRQHALQIKQELTKEEEAELGLIHEKTNKAWKEALAPYNTVEEEVTKTSPWADKFDPECDECHGTGTYKSKYNPKSRWDWWRVGGRWDGSIRRDPKRSADGGFNFDKKHEDIRQNSRLVTELLPSWEEKDTPFALVTPDGEWHERGKMGWWACVSNESPREEWSAKVKQLLEENKDCLAVGCDMHI